MALGVMLCIIYGVSQGLIGCVSYSTGFHNPKLKPLGVMARSFNFCRTQKLFGFRVRACRV